MEKSQSNKWVIISEIFVKKLTLLFTDFKVAILH